MATIGDSATVVYTPAQLSNAISADNGIDYVYLGDNIIMTSGIRIHPAKTALVIDGCYPPESADYYTLTDSGSSTGQIYVDSSQNLDLTFRNIVISGRNFYGMPRVYDYPGSENVVVTYQNATYNGPQTIYHLRGLARYIDCDITIMSNGYSSPEEVAQINRVEIGGNTVMRKTNNSDAIFWFTGSSTLRPYLKILSGANAEISTTHYFMYSSYNTAYIIEPGASFALNTGSGISYSTGHRVSSFQVGENASFYYTQTASRNVSAIYIDGDLTVNEGASFYMQADFNYNYPIISFTGDSSSLNILNPKSFALYNSGTGSGTSVLDFYYASPSTPFTLTGGQLNYWEAATAFPVAGTYYDTPQHKWHKPQWGTFTMTGTANNSATTISGTTFTAEELADLPPLSDLQLKSAHVLSIGHLPLLVNNVIIGIPITGTTEPGAEVFAEYTSSGTPYTTEVTAEPDGSFAIIVTPFIPVETAVKISSNTQFLITQVAMQAREDGELSIYSAPENIVFSFRPLAQFPYDIILPRLDTYAPVIVSDKRAVKTEWGLWASISGPLATAEGDILNNGVVFGLQNGGVITLSTEPELVHIDQPFVDERKSVTWDEDRGVLVSITAPVRSAMQYTTQITWEVRPV